MRGISISFDLIFLAGDLNSSSVSTGIDMSNFPGISGAPPANGYNMAFVITGTVEISRGGFYEFCLNSTDGGMMAMEGSLGGIAEVRSFFCSPPASSTVFLATR
jgi:hypothetical protein